MKKLGPSLLLSNELTSTLEIVTDRLSSEVDKPVATIEAKTDDSILAAMDCSSINRLELVMKSVDAFSGRDPGKTVIDPNQRFFSGDAKGHQITVSIRLNSNTDFNSINETRGKNFIEAGDLSVNERKIDRETRAHHNITFSKRLFRVLKEHIVRSK